MTVEHIFWIDSGNTPGWHNVTDVPEVLFMLQCESWGWLVGEDENFVYLSTTYVEGACLAPVSIPKGSITARIVIVAGLDI